MTLDVPTAGWVASRMIDNKRSNPMIHVVKQRCDSQNKYAIEILSECGSVPQRRVSIVTPFHHPVGDSMPRSPLQH